MAARAGREGEDRAAIRLGDASGQALILALGGAIALLAGALALVAISGAVTGKGLSKALVRQLQAQGASGEATLHLLAGATRAHARAVSVAPTGGAP